MARAPRWIRADLVCSSTQRTVDRQFLFKPDPEVRNLIGASAARALERFPVKIYWLDYNINHEQLGIAPIDDSREAATDLVNFKKMFHSMLAYQLNKRHGREGSVYSSRSRDIPCVDDASAEDRLFYAIINPVKDGLCDKIKHWGGFSSYAALGEGRSETFWYFDHTAWNRKGGKRSKKWKLEDFKKTVTLEFTPLPGWENLTPSQRQTRVRKHVRALEQHFREERRQQGRFAMTPEKIAKLDPRDRPKTTSEKTPRPICHAASKKARKIFEYDFGEFRKAHRQASCIYLSGHYDVEFPQGSFRPPLLACAA